MYYLETIYNYLKKSEMYVKKENRKSEYITISKININWQWKV